MFIELTAPRGVEVDSGDEKKKGKKLLRRGNGIEFPAPPSPFHFFVFFSSFFLNLEKKRKHRRVLSLRRRVFGKVKKKIEKKNGEIYGRSGFNNRIKVSPA